MSVNVNTSTNTITIQQDGTRVIQVNTPGPQGQQGLQGIQGNSIFTNISGNIWATTSSLQISNSLDLSGSLIAPKITGSLLGTSSWAENALTSSFIITAQTASYILQAVSASFATTASYVLNAVSSSFASTASHAATASYATINLQQVTDLGSTTTNDISANTLNVWEGNTLEYVNIGTTDGGLRVSSSQFVFNVQNDNISFGSASLRYVTIGTGNVTGTKQYELPNQSGTVALTTGSIFGTASWASQAVTASYLNILNQNLIITGSTDITGSSFNWNNNQVLTTPSTTTGTVVSFTSNQVYNEWDVPGTGNITNDLTGAKTGIVQKIYHNNSVAPSVPAGWVVVSNGVYVPNILNIIYAEWVKGTRVEYWITQ